MYTIKTKTFIITITISDNNLRTHLLDFAEEVRGKGLLYKISNSKVKDYEIYFMSNGWSAIYQNHNNLNIVINGIEKKRDLQSINKKITTEELNKIKTLLDLHASFFKLKII